MSSQMTWFKFFLDEKWQIGTTSKEYLKEGRQSGEMGINKRNWDAFQYQTRSRPKGQLEAKASEDQSAR